MSKEGMIKHREVLNAWLDGAEIEYYNTYQGRWISANPSMWDVSEQYRIKPAVQTRQAWVNVYPDCTNSYNSRSNADRFADTDERIACVPVTIKFTEGEGL